jgi:putative Mg2+ transporter-C (MgtC) family protein
LAHSSRADMHIGMSFDLSLLLAATVRMAVALALTLPIARERELHDMSAGLRTFPIVALGACGLVLLATSEFPPGSVPVMYVIQGLVTGVGFIGGGAILRANDRVRGTATAASIWSTAAIGACVGLGHAEIALVLALFTYLTLNVVSRMEAAHLIPPTPEAETGPRPARKDAHERRPGDEET